MASQEAPFARARDAVTPPIAFLIQLMFIPRVARNLLRILIQLM
jgi:hypothetical protein